MRDALLPQQLQQVGRGIGLDRIKRPARKLLDEEAGSPAGGVRTKQRDRLDRPQLRDLAGIDDAGDGACR